MALGMHVKGIAIMMDISYRTVEAYKYRVFAELGIANESEAVRMFAVWGPTAEGHPMKQPEREPTKYPERNAKRRAAKLRKLSASETPPANCTA